jgi:SRSO17 transposase
MFPACRTEGDGFAMPTFELPPGDIAGFTNALQECQGRFHNGFPRREPRAHIFDDMVGPLRRLARQSLEPMALQVPGGSIRGLQRLLSEVVWDAEPMQWTSHQVVADEMGAPDGVLRFDETGFVKKGQHSVSVARQYGGALGKVEHGQVGGFAGDASRQGYALVAKRLFLPEAWVTDAYAARRTTWKVPTERTCQRTPPLAAAMVQAIAHEGLLPCKYLVADGLSGQSPAFLDAVDACGGVPALVALPSETRCWLQLPRPAEPSSRYQEAARAKRVVLDPGSAACPVAAVAARRPASRWDQRTVSDGTTGRIAYAFARQRITLCTEGLPERTVWLVSKRTRGAAPSDSYASSHAPASTPWRLLVWLSGVRWAIEQCCEERQTA